MSATLLGTGASAVTLPATVATLFDKALDGGPVRGYYLKNNSGSVSAKIHVAGLHINKTDEGGTDGMATLAPGEERLFVNDAGIDLITGYGSGGTLSLTGYVQKK